MSGTSVSGYGSFGVYAPQDDTSSEPPRLLLVNLAPRDHICDGRRAGAESGRMGRQHAAADRAPAVEALLRFEHTFR
ncbi:MAG: hypothetical protein ACREMY_15685, partial [bacterium]